MAYFWTDKIHSVRYSNQEMNSVVVLWGDDNDSLREHYLAVDMEDQQFRDLLKEVTWDEIEENTQAQHEIHRQEFRDAFQRYAKTHEMDFGSDEVEFQGSLDVLFDFDETDEKHKEILFKLKLKMFEQDSVKESKSKTGKTAIRKATTPVEAVKAFSKFIK